MLHTLALRGDLLRHRPQQARFTPRSPVVRLTSAAVNDREHHVSEKGPQPQPQTRLARYYFGTQIERWRLLESLGTEEHVGAVQGWRILVGQQADRLGGHTGTTWSGSLLTRGSCEKRWSKGGFGRLSSLCIPEHPQPRGGWVPQDDGQLSSAQLSSLSLSPSLSLSLSFFFSSSFPFCMSVPLGKAFR